MIELTWLEMANPQFQAACQSIWDCPMLDGHTSYTAHRIQQAIEKADKEIWALRKEVLRRHGKKNENGELINDEKGNIVFEDSDKGPQIFEADFLKEFNGKKVTLKVSKIDFQKLVQVRGITPRHWKFLAPIVDNLPVEEGPANGEG